MERNELERILENHKKWLNGESGEKANLRDANLSGANLSGSNLYGANLRYANLRDTDLRGADLYGADLRGVDLYGANLRYANLRDTDLRGADLYGADLRGVDLYGADLRYADLCGVDLYGADLRGANLDFSCLPLRCGGLKWKADKRLMSQLAYHFCSMECEDEEVKEVQNAILKLANKFHRVSECGELKQKETKEVAKNFTQSLAAK